MVAGGPGASLALNVEESGGVAVPDLRRSPWPYGTGWGSSVDGSDPRARPMARSGDHEQGNMSRGLLAYFVVDCEPCYRHPPHVPGPEMRLLTATERRRLEKIERQVQELEEALLRARLDYALLVRSLGFATVAREEEVSRQALESRCRTILKQAFEAGLTREG
jgi:hypothetical protein